MGSISYEMIKDSIIGGFEEYVKEEGLSPQQATSKIFEEDWRWLVENDFSTACYFVLCSIESIKLNEIADFLVDKLEYYLEIKEFKEKVSDEDTLMFFYDLRMCKKMLEEEKYKVVKTSFDTKLRIDYLLSLDNSL